MKDAILNIKFDSYELHNKFKSICAVNRVTMRNKVLQLISDYVEAEKDKIPEIKTVVSDVEIVETEINNEIKPV